MKNKIFRIKNLILITGSIALINIGIGCVDLEEAPYDFVGPANFYGSVPQIEAAFASSMQRVYSEWSAYSYGWWAFANDDQMYDGSLVIDDDFASYFWINHYQAIADLNPAIAALNADVLGTSATQGEKDELMAQAKFLRAFNYFNLVRLYGDVPLVTEETDVINGTIVRTPKVDVYAQIESDLLFATQHLPATWAPEKHGRPARGAAKAILAKVYITHATAPINDASYFAKARDMAADVMNDGTNSLTPLIGDVFKLEYGYGPEMMWSFNASEDDNSTPPQIWLPSSMSDGWGDFKSDKVWGESYPAQPRKDAYLLLEDDNGDSYLTFNGQTPYVKKFLYDTKENQDRYRSVQNVPIIRYADVLLLFAEADNLATAGGSPSQAAVDAVNLIINRANSGVANAADPLTTTSMTEVDFDKAVIRQRNLELCFEFDRWFDLIRKKILCESQIPAYQVNCDANDYLWPIPQSDLRLNKGLTQNPGYTTPGE